MCQTSLEKAKGYKIHKTIIIYWLSDATYCGLYSGDDLSYCAWLCTEIGQDYLLDQLLHFREKGNN